MEPKFKQQCSCMNVNMAPYLLHVLTGKCSLTHSLQQLNGCLCLPAFHVGAQIRVMLLAVAARVLLFIFPISVEIPLPLFFFCFFYL